MVRRFLPLVAVTALLVPASAQAALPSASTGGTSDITQSTATLKGSINPNGEATTYHFQYGTTKAYGSQTPDQGPTAAVKQNQAVAAAISGLAPATTYHYRLVAVNASGTKLGGDKSFKTKTPAPAVSLGASRTRIVFGSSTVLSGQLTPSPGKPAAGVKITLHQNGKAVATANTDATGHFTFTQTPPTNSSYFATSATNPKATSPTVAVGVALRVTLSLSSTHPKRGHKVVFSGTVMPARTGSLVRIQKRVAGHWRTVRTGVLQAGATAQQSSYKVAVRIRTKGLYRAFVAGDASNVAGASRARTIRPR